MDIQFWSIFIIVGLMIGFAKTAVPGLGILIVPILVTIFPPKEAMGVLVPMLLTGDFFSLVWYSHHANWSRLLGLIPGLIAGITVGSFVLWWLNDATLLPLLGWMIVLLLILHLAGKRNSRHFIPSRKSIILMMGGLAGFATTVGNVAGPIMSIYLLAMGFSKEKFIGTGAWYYLIINGIKIPLYIGLGMITWHSFRFNILIVPAIALGALLGKWMLPHIPQKLFDAAVVGLTALGALRMIIVDMVPVS